MSFRDVIFLVKTNNKDNFSYLIIRRALHQIIDKSGWEAWSPRLLCKANVTCLLHVYVAS